MKISFVSVAPKAAGRTLVVRFSEGKQPEIVRESDGHRILAMSRGKKGTMTKRRFIVLVRKIVSLAKGADARRLIFSWEDFTFPELGGIGAGELASTLAQNLVLADFEFVKYKTEPKEGWKRIAETVIVGAPAALKKAFDRGVLIGSEVNACRSLANTPGGEMTPAILADEAHKAAKGTKVKVAVLGIREMKALKMGAILGVAAGSVNEPRFIILEYKGGAGKEKPIVLVGKGVTFDTGGLNLKPTNAIYEMHMDMSGGAAVIHAIVAAARLGAKKHLVGLIPAVENMPSGSSYRPGDILRSMSGKTIEVLNTDAEGRVILADALTYAKRYDPKIVVDVATLTGAALVALGQHASAILTPDDKLQELFCRLGEESGDYVWPLPLWEEYEDMVKGTFGDVSNLTSNGNTSYGGTISGAMFLKQFADGYPWVHIDIASRMTPAPGEPLAKGATGAPVRLLLKLIEAY